jgi:predicted RNA binding protein YcfA (HicA-like mRNA interferase family)
VSSKKDTRDLIRELQRQGFSVEEAKSGHYKVRKDGRLVTTLAKTPSDVRSIRNARAILRRHGFTG